MKPLSEDRMLSGTTSANSNDLTLIKSRIGNVISRIGNIKKAVYNAMDNGGNEVSVNYLKSELESVKINMVKFKNILKTQPLVYSESIKENVDPKVPSIHNKLVSFVSNIDDKTRTLFERVGGDVNIETSVDVMYYSALLDSRTRAFFEKNGRKMSQIRKKMHQFICTLFGGPKQYDIENLKPAHYHMNITDFHFDAVLELFQQSLIDLGVHIDAVTDAISVMGKVRKYVTTGCTVRMELARKHTEKGRDDLYKRLDGDKGISKFMDRLYELISVDSRLKKFFSGKNINQIKEGQRVYITELLGGPKSYKGRPLEEIHKGMNVDDYFFDCFIMDCEKAFAGLSIDETTIDEVIVTLEPVRAAVLGRQRGLLSSKKLVDGKTILERMGGESNLEAVIETMYSGCVVDPRVKFFFLANKEKISSIKSNMVKLLTGVLGGSILYDVNNLRPAHYGMNITDYHFDAVLENLSCACELMEVEQKVTVDAFEAIARVRSDVTAGCTVRLEIARKTTESAGTEGLFTHLGGEAGIVKLIDSVYEYVLTDDRISHFISGSKLPVIKQSQGAFLAQLFGSKNEYQGRDLDRIHSMISVNDFHFDAFIQDTAKALRAQGADGESIDQCTVLMESCRKSVAQSRNHDVKKAQEAANKKSLHERLGGDVAIVKIMDTVYDKSLLDDRIRSFFEKNKAKIQTIKKKMIQFVTGLCGGASLYDISDLKPTHYAMNISDFHFDAILDIFHTVMNDDIKAKKSDIKDLMKVLQPIRSHVTTGCTVRMEIARKNLEKGRDQLFLKLGKGEGIKKLIDQVYEVINNDPRIKKFFESANQEKIKTGQIIFITELLGGPKIYKGRELPSIHEKLGITDYNFDAFLNDLQRAMMGSGFAEGLMDEVLITLEQVRPDILNRKADLSATVSTSADKRPLIEKLGGDMNLETIVENMYEKAVEDTRMRFHFEKAKAKQRQIRQKMYQFLSGAFGGPVQYEAKNLRPAHYGMNITDFHFDAIIEAFTSTCKDMSIEPDIIDDALVVVNKIRPDITTGCTVRMELARKKNQLDGSDQLFSRLGGMEGMDSFVMRLYEIVERDKRISMFFEGSKLKLIKRSQTDLLIMTLGGPSEYKGRTLEEIHAVLNMTDYHLDCFFQSIQRALRDNGVDADAVDEATVVLEPLRRKILKTHYEKMGFK